MTRTEALAEARRRWGGNASIHSYIPRKPSRPAFTLYRPPMEREPQYPQVMGRGDSWEAAFADADRRAAK